MMFIIYFELELYKIVRFVCLLILYFHCICNVRIKMSNTFSQNILIVVVSFVYKNGICNYAYASKFDYPPKQTKLWMSLM